MKQCHDLACPDCRPDDPAKRSSNAIDRRCDAQLQLVGPENQPACNLEYDIRLADGTHHTGATDAQGRTRRIETRNPISLTSITLSPSLGRVQQECRGWDLILERVDIPLLNRNLSTRYCGAGLSVDIVKLPKPHKRGLTGGEIAMARTVFGDGLNYKSIYIHNHGWWLFMGMQDRNTAVTPNGQMYFPDTIYRHDFSAMDARDRALFMHEMAHVWQHQMGYSIKWHGLTVTSQGHSAYAYQLTTESRLSEFNMEQQGHIISDYYMICVLNDPGNAFNPRTNAELLHAVIKPLLANPRDRNLLPQ